jgi:hypothetical protein
LAYAIIAYATTEGEKRSIKTLINYFSVSFFFLMWLVGQCLRTSKELKDSSNYTTIQTGIADLQKAISNLHPLAYQSAQTSTASIKNTQLQSARQAVEAGFVLAGLMQAGVAFEQAILSKADQLQIRRDSRMTVTQVLNQLKQYYDQSIINEFYAIWKLRNQLVHLTPEAANELEKSPSLIKYFEWAISQLEAEQF